MLTLVLLCATPADAPLETMTHDELKAEYHRLDEARPSVAPPIVMMASAAAPIFSGLIMLLWAGLEGVQLNLDFYCGLDCSPAPAPRPPPDFKLYLAGGAALVAGAALLLTGVFRLVSAIEERQALSAHMAQIVERLGVDPVGAPPPVPSRHSADDDTRETQQRRNEAPHSDPPVHFR